MTKNNTGGIRVLIVEDEYFVADDTRSVLMNAGVHVLGPVPSAAEARALIDRDPTISGVLLDINLRGEMAFDVADQLRARGIPFAFVTGYDRSVLPPRFADVPSVQKPLNGDQLAALVADFVTVVRPAMPD